MRTYVAKGAEAEALKVGADWFVVDATDVVLGRLATKVARMLMGKDKASFTPYLDSGDHVFADAHRDVVGGAEKVEKLVVESDHGYFPDEQPKNTGRRSSGLAVTVCLTMPAKRAHKVCSLKPSRCLASRALKSDPLHKQNGNRKTGICWVDYG